MDKIVIEVPMACRMFEEMPKEDLLEAINYAWLYHLFDYDAIYGAHDSDKKQAYKCYKDAIRRGVIVDVFYDTTD